MLKEVGLTIAQWTPNDLPPQHWRLEVQADERGIVSGSQYKTVEASSGRCMDDPEGSNDTGRAIGVWSDNGLLPQRWRVEWVHDNGYRIIRLLATINAPHFAVLSR